MQSYAFTTTKPRHFQNFNAGFRQHFSHLLSACSPGVPTSTKSVFAKKQLTSSPVTHFQSPFMTCECHFPLLPLATVASDRECSGPISQPWSQKGYGCSNGCFMFDMYHVSCINFRQIRTLIHQSFKVQRLRKFDL